MTQPAPKLHLVRLHSTGNSLREKRAPDDPAALRYRRWRKKNHAKLLAQESLKRRRNRARIRAQAAAFRKRARERKAAQERELEQLRAIVSRIRAPELAARRFSLERISV